MARQGGFYQSESDAAAVPGYRSAPADRGARVLLFYIDEFGDAAMDGDPRDPSGKWAMKQGASDLFILAAVGIAETQRLDLAHALVNLKKKWFPDHLPGAWNDSELKGRYLQVAGERLKASQPATKPAAYRSLTRQSFGHLMTELGRIWHRFNPMVYAIVIDKRELVAQGKRFSPIGLSYTLLQQRLTLLMDRVYGRTEGCLLIADQQTSHEAYFRSGAMHATRRELTKSARHAPHGQPPNFELILDKPIWIDPELNVLDREIIQLADIAAHTTAQLVQRDAAPQEPWFLWKQISHQFVREWSTGFIEEAGITIYPRRAAYPPGLR